MKIVRACLAVLLWEMGLASSAIAAETNSASTPQAQVAAKIERAIGICHPIENQEESRLSAVNGVAPVSQAMSYIEEFNHRKYSDADYLSVYHAAKMTLLQPPKHGELGLDEENQVGRYFSSDYNYEGRDSATVLVEAGGYKVKVVYHFVLMSDVPGSGEEGTATDNKRICPNGYKWNISTAK